MTDGVGRNNSRTGGNKPNTPPDLNQWGGRDPTDKSHPKYDPLQDPTAPNYDPRSDKSRKDYDPKNDPKSSQYTGQKDDEELVGEDGLTTEQYVQQQLAAMGFNARPEQLPADIQALFSFGEGALSN